MAIDFPVESNPTGLRRSPREATKEPSPTASPRATGASLALAIMTDRVQGYLLESISGVYRLVAWASMPRYVEKDIPSQIAGLCRTIGAQINRTLWDSQANSPLTQAADPVRNPPLDTIAMAASPLPLLRTWVIALSSTHSMAAAELAIAAAPVQIIGRAALDAEISVNSLTRALISDRPDVVVVVGGFDTANATAQQPLRIVTAIVTNVMQSLPTHMRPFLLFAGNQWVGVDFEQQLRDLAGMSTQVVPNVMPVRGVVRQDALAHALDNYYLSACRDLSGFEHIAQWITGPARIASVESFFARLVHVWMQANDLNELHALYCAADRWLHVWTSAQATEVQLLYTQPGRYPTALHEWPGIQLLSGSWASVYGPRPQVIWWDRAGMAPAIATIGQFSADMMLQVLEADVLIKMRHAPRASANHNAEW